MPSAKLLQNLLSRRPRRGSALLITLVMIGIFSIIVGAMLFVVNQNARSARDKIAFETAYQTALAGTHLGRAWLLKPQLATDWYGNGSMTTALQGLLTCATGMSTDYVTKNGNLAGATSPGQIASTYFTKYGFSADGKTLSDGRVVLYDMSTSVTGKKIASFPNDSIENKYSGKIFADRSDAVSFIDGLRFTTVPSSDNLPSALNEVTIMIESRGVAVVHGMRKERVVQERILIFPTVENVPLVSTGAAIVGGNGIGLKNANSSHFNVNWGPVQAKGNVQLLNFGFDASKKTLTAGNKFLGAGVAVNENGWSGTEKWLKWQVGKGAVLTDGDVNAASPTSIFNGLSGVTDFFAQLKAGTWAAQGWLASGANTILKNYVASTAATGEDFGLWDTNDDGQFENGAFVQDSQKITDSVNKFFDETMKYDLWKAFAIDRGMYLKPSGSYFVNELNQPLYLASVKIGAVNTYEITTNASDGNKSPNTRLSPSNVANLSMKWQLERAGGNPHTNDPLLKVDDRILFIDNASGTSAKPASMPKYDFGSGFFWKGMMYINGSIRTTGGGSYASILTKDPDQFKTDPYGSSTGQTMANCYMDGILMVTGDWDCSGNSMVYGTIGVVQSGGLTGTPRIYYNSANGKGRFKDPTATPTTFQIIAGRISEPASGWQ